MRRALLGLSFLVAVSLLAADLVWAGPKNVTMYGASWCGPCRRLRAWFSASGVRHTYVDVDTAEGAKAFAREAGGQRSIPLTVIDRKKFRGADVASIAQELGLAPRAEAPRSSGPSYGGRSPEAWQKEFKELRDYVGWLEGAVARLEKQGADHLAKQELERRKNSLMTARAALSQLDSDASKVALPRQFRK